MERLIDWAERGWLPDAAIRAGIRHLLRRRLRESGGSPETLRARREALVRAMREAPVALSTDTANEQHYELPTEYFEACLGPWMKYSSGWWPEGVEDLAGAEAAMLQLTTERAELADGQRILELGCGWGSLSLWMAEQFPRASILAVSNSATQRAAIEHRRDALGLTNLEVVTADMNDFRPAQTGFDRVVSVEMFEHMRNWPELFRRIHDWLRPGGRFFMHVFAHRDRAYFFETDGDADWMARHFFRDGLMPSEDLVYQFQDDLRVRRQWRVGGEHYARSLNAWLERQDAARERLLSLFSRTQDAAEAARVFQRWRMFYMACDELFARDGGGEWFVSHTLLERPLREAVQ
ncbi:MULTISPECIES: cyclopropane-fatty-acyl-phospholipid synthase family protein [unclassified Thioalkalivibrio]|uniref:SAM-dependent methyltransferase n=1 Tax=unclassified Thioalkalivibrio TaxID=2621013 RepID=UPI00037B3BC1|nr:MULTISPECIES: cyclopropane-fatty-acyl-phospholipid synthase family protein [unclassified Thioalkalivibrio]